MVESLILVDPIKLGGNSVLPQCVAICLIKFEGMLRVLRDFHPKFKLGTVNACLVCTYHRNHPFIILEKLDHPVPLRMFNQSSFGCIQYNSKITRGKLVLEGFNVAFNLQGISSLV